MTESVKSLIVENIYKIKSENREIEEIVLGEEAYQKLAKELDLPPDYKSPVKVFFSYPIKILSYFPPDYIGLRFKRKKNDFIQELKDMKEAIATLSSSVVELEGRVNI